MQERDILDDVLTSQKNMTGTYNTCANECATPSIRDSLVDILTEEHQIQADVFNEMSKRGWYPVQQAEQQKIQHAKQKYEMRNHSKRLHRIF